MSGVLRVPLPQSARSPSGTAHLCSPHQKQVAHFTEEEIRVKREEVAAGITPDRLQVGLRDGGPHSGSPGSQAPLPGLSADVLAPRVGPQTAKCSDPDGPRLTFPPSPVGRRLR